MVLPLSWRQPGGWLQPLLILSAMAWLYAWRLRDKCRRIKALEGKVVVLTGASSGLGEALAHRLYAAGCRLIIMARSVDQLDRVRQDVMLAHQRELVYPPVVLPLDLSDSDGVKAAVGKALRVFGRVDVLINNAGVSYRGEALHTELEVDARLMQVNYLGQLAAIKTVLPSMVEQRSGQIVCVSSVQGRLALPYRSAYAASKHALQAFCDCLRAEVADHNVHVTVVSPGYIRTSLSLNALTGSGAAHGKLDATTALLAPLRDRLAVLLRALLPSVFFLLMRLRARAGTGRPS
ncbi:dehydrogenase/reductase SDR family protein 7-like [Pollicipes pollicipes]|uniref:dehydrogenase/reductase SDR family protein 7-like n=1 Tax=Pollicipes pollicipes TaxID=41117 RepID=UPI0018854E28|nr:dehydrogenase/reductase SDR family protein 7-like [Pollicipes pollicipes]